MFFKALTLFIVFVSYLVIYPVISHAQEIEIQNKPNKDDNSLYQVLSVTYENNSTIRAARAELLAFQEQLDQAKSGYKPQISADADIIYTNTKTDGSSFINSDGGNVSQSATLNLNQPVYRGGTTTANVERVQSLIGSQNYRLSAIEQSILNDGVAAYMSLYRDRTVLDLRQSNLTLIEKELEQAQLRFKVGEITRTDVSQSEARLASAQADMINAQAMVQSSAANFVQITKSQPPVHMAYPVFKFEIPQTLDAAIALAQTNNRDVLQANFNKQAAEQDIKSIEGELKPQVSAIGRLQKIYGQSDFLDEQRQAVLGLSASMPLYAGGVVLSRIRAAEKTKIQRAEQVNATKERVKQEVITRWKQLEAARAETKARQSQIKAASIAQEGVHYEIEFGERTTLDALNANQELLSAQVDLVQSKQNEVVAYFSLAERLGLLVPQNLGFSTINSL